jgi:ketosteroid isomerase-like protein
MARENLEIVKRLYRLFARGERSAAFELYAEDVLWDTSHTNWTEPRAYTGHEGVRQFWRKWLAAWDDYRAEPYEFVAFSDHVAVGVLMSGRGKESGVPVSLPHTQLFTLHEGKVNAVRIFNERSDAFALLGLDVPDQQHRSDAVRGAYAALGLGDGDPLTELLAEDVEVEVRRDPGGPAERARGREAATRRLGALRPELEQTVAVEDEVEARLRSRGDTSGSRLRHLHLFGREGVARLLLEPAVEAPDLLQVSGT